MKNPTIYMMIGTPASGKSTLAKMIAEKTNAVIVSSDEIRETIFKHIEYKDQDQKEIFGLVHKRAKELLENGNNVIYDATNITKRRRRQALAHFKNIPHKTIAIFLNTPIDICLSQNKTRSRITPSSVILQMYQQIQPPEVGEGFDKCYDICRIVQS